MSAPASPATRPSTPAGPPVGSRPASATSSARSVAGDGRVVGTVTAFDLSHPAVANLNPALRKAMQQATRAAGEDGVTLRLNAGWRSRALQQRLLDEATKRYGSRAVALKWVATPERSKHVTGEAVDVAGAAAAAWLQRNGRAWGLCRTYANEAWHFELATRPGGTCPPMRPDARS